MRGFGVLALIFCANAVFAEDQTKIVGGREVDVNLAPFIAELMYKNRHHCGCSIITFSYALTAAHCTEEKRPKQLAIRAGSSMKGEGDYFYVSHIFPHPEYLSTNYNYDACIVKIHGRFLYGDNIKAVMLPQAGEEVPAGEAVRTLGWGHTMNPFESSDHLRGVELIVTSSEECEEAYKIYKLNASNKICAIHPDRIDGKDSCQGDSGGPLQSVVTGKLIGVVSFGQGCAKKEYPGVYLKVSSVRDWIKKIANI